MIIKCTIAHECTVVDGIWSCFKALWMLDIRPLFLTLYRCHFSTKVGFEQKQWVHPYLFIEFYLVMHWDVHSCTSFIIMTAVNMLWIKFERLSNHHAWLKNNVACSIDRQSWTMLESSAARKAAALTTWYLDQNIEHYSLIHKCMRQEERKIWWVHHRVNTLILYSIDKKYIVNVTCNSLIRQSCEGR